MVFMKINKEKIDIDTMLIIEHRINQLRKNLNYTFHSFIKMKSRKISKSDIKTVFKEHEIIECDITQNDFRVLLASKTYHQGKQIIVCTSLIDGNIITVYKRNRVYSQTRYLSEKEEENLNYSLIALYNQLVR